MKFRKKPVVVDAVLWNGNFTNLVKPFVHPSRASAKEGLCSICSLPYLTHGWINTLEGGHIVCRGDWIITGVAGEHYPCKPSIFERTYERVDGSE